MPGGLGRGAAPERPPLSSVLIESTGTPRHEEDEGMLGVRQSDASIATYVPPVLRRISWPAVGQGA